MAGNVIPFPRRPSPDEPVDPDGRGEAATPGFVDSLSAADRVVIVTMSGRRHYAAEQPHEVRRGDPTRWAAAVCTSSIEGIHVDDWPRRRTPADRLSMCRRCAERADLVDQQRQDL